MLNSRKDLILLLLHAPGQSGLNEPITGRTRLVKLLFLGFNHDELAESVKLFEFRPDNFGPNSDVMQDDVEMLCDSGLVKVENEKKNTNISLSDFTTTVPRVNHYKLTDKGVIIAKVLSQRHPEEFKSLTTIKKKFNSIPLNDLISFVYRNSPREWTSKSIIADRHL